MADPIRIDVITIFPESLEGILGSSMMKRATQLGLARFHLINLRDFTTDKHHTTDDRPYGGGPGMIMKPEPLHAAVESVRTPESRVIYMTPQGTPFKQSLARELAVSSHLIFICGHYEGIDERIVDLVVTDEISIGDYILTSGVLPAAVVIDATVRLVPGVLGAEGATETESFEDGLLDYPQYTRPPEFMGLKVPEILFSGDHQAVADWRHQQAKHRTRTRRPDLLD